MISLTAKRHLCLALAAVSFVVLILMTVRAINGSAEPTAPIAPAISAIFLMRFYFQCKMKMKQ